MTIYKWQSINLTEIKKYQNSDTVIAPHMIVTVYVKYGQNIMTQNSKQVFQVW